MATKKQAAKSTAKKDKTPFPGAKKVRTVVRDAATGRLAPKDAAKKNPKGTVTEKVNTDDVIVKVKKSALKMPKSLAGVADALYTTKQRRLAAQKEIAPLGEFEKALKEYLINNLPKSQAEGISGRTANARIVRKEIPIIEDEKKVLAFAKKPGNEDLIKISINMEAVELRWNEGKTVPGVGKHTVVTVSSTKLK